MSNTAQEQRIIAAYKSRGMRGLKSVAVSAYWCHDSRSCLLLYVWRSPDGLLFYRPPYKIEPGRNAEQSNESGRAANTTDGDNHWCAVGGVLDAMRTWPPPMALELRCDHVEEKVPGADLLAVADAATPGKPTRVTI